MSKSYVTMEQNICSICGKSFDTGSLLLDTRIRDRFESKIITGYGLCPEDQELYDQGYVALVGVNTEKSKISEENTISQENAYRTGEIVHMRKDALKSFFTSEVPDNLPLLFVEPEVINLLKEQQKQLKPDNE